MPGFILHMLHGQFILSSANHHLDEEKVNQFMLGILMPDSKKDILKDISHFFAPDSKNVVLRVPDLDSFISKYQKHLSEPFVIGYLAHLWLDKVFFEDFFTKYVDFQDKNGSSTSDRSNVSQVYIVRQGKNISSVELFSDDYLYGDYTNLNSALIKKYALTIPHEIHVENPVEEVELKDFDNIRSDLEKYFAMPVSENLELKIFCQEEVEEFISCQAQKFIEYYQKQIEVSVLDNRNVNTNRKTNCSMEQTSDSNAYDKNFEDNFDTKFEEVFEEEFNKVFGPEFDEELCEGMSEFDVKSEEYYHHAWKHLCKRARTLNTEDLLFMDRLILRARYIHLQKENHKNRHFNGEGLLINLALVNTILNALKCSPLEQFGAILDKWFPFLVNSNFLLTNGLNIACVVVSAFTAWYTSRVLLFSPKETWLRHVCAYSNITLEADSLFAEVGEYSEISDIEKIKRFKAKIVGFTIEDYQNFFANMSGSKDGWRKNAENTHEKNSTKNADGV